MFNGKRYSIILGMAVLVLVSVDAAWAQTYFGRQLMTPQELEEHRAVMRSLPPNAREAYRAQQHEAMKKRAESLNLPLPDRPRAYGGGFGRGGPGYGHRHCCPGYRGPGYGGWRNRGGYGAGYGDWGQPAGN